jgi:predicted nucleic acid-binding Zn ribbon protein
LPERYFRTPPATCPHRHTRLVARDLAGEYRECLDCGEILEKEETPVPACFDESLSDA